MAAANVEGVSYVIDTDPHKQGLFTPVLHLPIHSPEILNIQPVDTILITALAYTNEILDQLNQINFKGASFGINDLFETAEVFVFLHYGKHFLDYFGIAFCD